MKNVRRWSVVVLTALCCVSLYGSYHMITDPTGNSLGLPFYLLIGTVFSDYSVLGWILFGTTGMFSLLTIVCTLLKTGYHSFLIILQGVLVCIFTFAVMLLFRYVFIAEIFLLASGIVLIALGVWQNQHKIEKDSGR